MNRILIAVAIVAALTVCLALAIRHDLGWSDVGPPSLRTTSSESPSPSTRLESHPLAAALDLAEKVKRNIDANVRDYTATVIKQERYGGVLGPEEICDVKIRNEPLSVYMGFLAPEKLKGQEAIYVAGANDGNLVGHAGSGPAALLGSKWLPPRGPIAMFGQRYPITEMGIANLVQRLIEVGQHDMQYGECYVWRNDNAKVGDRPCTSFTVMHPERRPEFLFHIARIFVDKDLMVPLHYEAYDWPEKPGDPPPLLERYTYAQLKLNPGLTDEDFDPHNDKYHFFSK